MPQPASLNSPPRQAATSGPTSISIAGWQELVDPIASIRVGPDDRAGVIFELGALIDILPMSRVALLVDQTTDEPLLRRILADRWRNMSPDSPNALSRSATARIIDLAGGYPTAVGRLLRLGDDVLASDVGDAAA